MNGSPACPPVALELMFILLSVRPSVRPSLRLSVRLPIPSRLRRRRRLHVQVVIAGFHHCGAVTAAGAAGATPRVHVPGLRA